MISIIICSRNSDISVELKQNIAETIGCDYELVVIDNSCNQYSIFQAYNKGVNRSRGDVLCFLHDDILFKSVDWGKLICNLFAENEDFGEIGVLGGHLLSKTESYYLLPSGNILQLQKNGKVEMEWRNDHFDERGLDEVAALDGLFFAIPQKSFNEDNGIWFDETMGGFHMYDMDISMQVRKAGKKCMVTKKILVQHNSKIAGVLEGSVFKNSLHEFYKKWNHDFPIIVGISNEYLSEKYVDLYYKLESIHFSHAYKIGKLLLKPIKFIKRFFK